MNCIHEDYQHCKVAAKAQGQSLGLQSPGGKFNTTSVRGCKEVFTTDSQPVKIFKKPVESSWAENLHYNTDCKKEGKRAEPTEPNAPNFK